MENSEAASTPEITPGQRLREAREATGMSPREMADRLNWLPSYVTAIEENRFDQLRGSAFVRGYLRAYARAVGLDEDEIVERYLALHPEEAERSAQTASAPPANAPSQKTGFAVVLGVAVAAVVIGAIWWKQQQPEESAVVSRPATSTPADPAADEASSVPRDAEEPEISAAAAVEETEDTAAEAQAPAPEPLVQAGSDNELAAETPVELQEQAEAVAAIAPEVSSDIAAVSDAIAADGPLQFSFSGDCWLEVRDGEGQLIYADLRRAGDTLGLDGVPPFEILAGDAAAVSLRYQGESIPIRTRPGRDTARFTVGEP